MHFLQQTAWHLLRPQDDANSPKRNTIKRNALSNINEWVELKDRDTSGKVGDAVRHGDHSSQLLAFYRQFYSRYADRWIIAPLRSHRLVDQALLMSYRDRLKLAHNSLSEVATVFPQHLNAFNAGQPFTTQIRSGHGDENRSCDAHK